MNPSPSHRAAQDVDAAAVAAAATALAAGELVGVATDGFLALAARADRPETRMALWEASARAGASSPSLLRCPDRLELSCECAGLVRRIAQRHWPGPLILEVRAEGDEMRWSNDAWMPLCCPAEPHARALAEAAKVPLLLATIPQATDATSFRRLTGTERVLGSRQNALSELPAWLRVARGVFELRRDGLYSLDTLRTSAGLAIGFVCTGNTCRSPMAESLARRLLAKRLGVEPSRIGDFGFRVLSMGTFAAPYQPASAHSVEAVRELGGDLTGHRSQVATWKLLADLQRVYCLTRVHMDQVRLLLPADWPGQLALLDEHRDVTDPIGGSLVDYRECARQIRAALERRLEEWL